MKDVKELIKEYISQAFLMQIATSANNQPWACTVHFASDDNFNFYWISAPSTRHSKEINENSKVAGTIVLPHKMDDKPRGLQFEGTAREVSDPAEGRKLYPIYGKKFDYMEILEDIISGKNHNRLYEIKPNSIVLFDTVNFPQNPRQELKLN